MKPALFALALVALVAAALCLGIPTAACAAALASDYATGAR